MAPRRAAAAVAACLLLLATLARAQEAPAPAVCAAGCDVDNGGCVLDAALPSGARCQRCLDGFVPDRATGVCGCPKAKYSGGLGVGCQNCPQGSYCPGGALAADLAPNVPPAVPCGPGLTTLGPRAASAEQCVNAPGHARAMDRATGRAVAVECPAGTYSQGLKDQATCTPCPTGTSTRGVAGASHINACRAS